MTAGADPAEVVLHQPDEVLLGFARALRAAGVPVTLDRSRSWLEAAALGLPAICTPRALHGLKGQVPFLPLSSPAEWANELLGLWADAERRRKFGEAARAWVTVNHTWTAAARTAAGRRSARPR